LTLLFAEQNPNVFDSCEAEHDEATYSSHNKHPFQRVH